MQMIDGQIYAEIDAYFIYPLGENVLSQQKKPLQVMQKQTNKQKTDIQMGKYKQVINNRKQLGINKSPVSVGM